MKDQILFQGLWAFGPDKYLEETGFPDEKGWESYLGSFRRDLRLEAYYRAEREFYRWYLKGLSRWIGIDFIYSYLATKPDGLESTCVAEAKEGSIGKIFDSSVNKELFNLLAAYSSFSEWRASQNAVLNGLVVDAYVIQTQVQLSIQDSRGVIEEKLHDLELHFYPALGSLLHREEMKAFKNAIGEIAKEYTKQ